MAEVAALAGVSLTTVSHVLSGKRPVRAATAERVRRALAELEYVPNHAGRSLRSAVTSTVSLLLPDISNPYFAELAKGAEDATEAEGFNLVLCNTDFNREREARYLTVLRGGAFDGMIYVAGAPPPRRRLSELARSFPLTVADEELNGLSAVTVVSDNFGGGRLAGEHLAGLGHTRVLYVGGPRALRTTELRRDGLLEGLGARAALRERYGDYREPSGYEAVRAELRGRRSFTAVFAGNDLMALGAIRALQEAGKDVPEDVSVVGYDDISLAALVRPALTTIRQPVYDIGRAAAEQLLIRLRRGHQGPPAKLVLDVELVVRATSAERPSRGAR
jgi:LacI family transcriptional regulator